VTTSDRFYEVLGMRPGASRQELKAAYRDLTKVWHPDRFAHDPRLQQKAEEKLKEINEAYEQLMSGKTWRLRMSHSPRASATVVRDHREQRNSHSPVVPVKSRSLLWLLAPLIIFGCVFAFTIRFLHAKANRQPQAVIEQHTTEPPVGSSSETRPVDPQSDRRANETSVTGRQITEQQRLPTTTVTIDSTTGLLARDECPTKVSMTYPAGSEPRAYCNAHPATRSSKLKSLQKHTDSSTDEAEKNPQEPYQF
jgi:hypothetical protein